MASLPHTQQCPACGSTMLSHSAWFLTCPHCGLYRSTLEAGPGKAFEGLEALRRQNFDRILAEMSKLHSLAGARVLEIGCARGWFLQAARQQGAEVNGVEPVSGDAAVARRAGIPVEEGLFPEAPSDKRPYDFIVFNDVFEHLPDPVEAIGAVESLLQPGGLLVINLPSSEGTIYNIARLMNRLGVSGPFDRMWQKGLPSPHLSYFSPSNLRRLVEGHSTLRQVRAFRLPSVSRSGLADRVSGQGVGIPTWLLTPAIWTMSFVLPVLPSDIHVAIFRKPASN